jgi:hypothetical protein
MGLVVIRRYKISGLLGRTVLLSLLDLATTRRWGAQLYGFVEVLGSNSIVLRKYSEVMVLSALILALRHKAGTQPQYVTSQRIPEKTQTDQITFCKGTFCREVMRTHKRLNW